MRPGAGLAREIRERLGLPPRSEDPPAVSIVVPNRDGAEHLRRLFAGLTDRTDYRRFELILVDNGSSDDSIELARHIDAPFPVSTLANTRDASFSDACNRGAEVAEGSHLLFLNNDIEPFEPGWLKELVACLEGSDAGAVSATLLCDEDEHRRSFAHGYGVQHRGLRFQQQVDGRTVPVLRGWEDDPLDQLLGEDLDCEAIAAACLLIEKATFESIGGFASGYSYGCEDVDLCLALRRAGRRVVCSGRSIAIHHPASTRRTIPFAEAQRAKQANRELLWRRWGPQLRPDRDRPGQEPPLIQYWHETQVPPEVAHLVDTFRTRNPHLRHLLFSKAEAEELIGERFGPRELRAFRACAVPAMQSDYFRFCAVYALGGIWADADLRCMQSVEVVAQRTESGLLFRAPLLGNVINDFFCFAEARHPLLRLAVRLTTVNIERRHIESVAVATGPAVLNSLATLCDLGSFDRAHNLLARRRAGGEKQRHRDLQRLLSSVVDEIGSIEPISDAFRTVRIETLNEVMPKLVRRTRPAYKDGGDHWPAWQESGKPIYDH